MQEAISEMDGIAVYFAPRPLITVLGVKYLHLRVQDGTDLYVTEHGLPFTKCLLPENHWVDDAWMKQHSVRLPGTSAVFRVRTKEVNGRSKDIVVKWNRMGQDIPGETQAVDASTARVQQPLHGIQPGAGDAARAHTESPGRLYTHRPLAIYVPRKFVQGEQLGRRRYKMEAIQRSHEEIPIDWNRNYAVIYEWLKGIDAVEACREGLLDKEELTELDRPVLGGSGRQGFHGQ